MARDAPGAPCRPRAWPRLWQGYEHRWRRALGVLGPADLDRSLSRLIRHARMLAEAGPAGVPDVLDAVDRRLAVAVQRYAHVVGRQSLASLRWPGRPEPRFVCEGALGALARWLRAAGLAAQHPGPDTRAADLIGTCVAQGSILLTTDTRVLRHGSVRDGVVAALWIPSARTPIQQLGIVLRDLGLRRRRPLCMACGGVLGSVERADVLDDLPPRTARWKIDLWRCRDCGRLYWQGSHWERIRRGLEAAAAG